MGEFSDFVIYADESSDHGLTSIDPSYPIFVLCFCIFRKTDYTTRVSPGLQDLKFRFFGHDGVVLHSHDIRKAKGDFAMLFDRSTRDRFVGAINEWIESAPFTIVASVIRKEELKGRYARPENPYDIALRFCMERAYAYLKDNGEGDRTTHVLVERRGKREDNELELEFRRIVQGENQWGALNFAVRFVDKAANSAGLQLADLVAHPIGTRQLRPDQPNRAYDIVDSKFRRSPKGRIDGWGLKVFP